MDRTTGEPLRDENGFCIQCPPHEEGEFIGKIVRGDPVKGILYLIQKSNYKPHIMKITLEIYRKFYSLFFKSFRGNFYKKGNFRFNRYVISIERKRC